MNIVTIVRTLNEERNIERFIKQYSFSDKILISDGGSTDQTVAIAQRYAPKVEIQENFPVRIPLPDGRYYTHEPIQINMLIQWALQHRPDWIIYDDADCFPNAILSTDARSVLTSCGEKGAERVRVYRYYLWGKDRYFPDLNKPGQSLWAWNPHTLTIRCREDDPREQNMMFSKTDVKDCLINEPYVLLHDFAPDEQSVRESLKWYKLKGQPKLHPLKGCGRLALLPEYAHI